MNIRKIGDIILENTNTDIYVGGYTFNIRGDLRELGGQWQPDMKKWKFDIEKYNQIEDYLNNITKKEEVYNENGVKIFKYKRSYLVIGKTFDKKEMIKSLRGQWNPTNKGWIVPFKKGVLEELISIMEGNYIQKNDESDSDDNSSDLYNEKEINMDLFC